MTYTLIHNPVCTSSNKGLALLKDHGVELNLRKYMNASEQLSTEELKDIAKKMGDVSPRTFLRVKNSDRINLPELASDEEVFLAMAETPKLIQRPIGIKGDKAILGRPYHKLLDIL